MHTHGNTSPDPAHLLATQVRPDPWNLDGRVTLQVLVELLDVARLLGVSKCTANTCSGDSPISLSTHCIVNPLIPESFDQTLLHCKYCVSIPSRRM